jgi:2-oxoglutarate ferredoxin oxidoreductase subunit alpha
MALSSRQLGAAPITRNSTALGALCYLLDLPLPLMLDVLHKVFKEKALEANITLANKGFDLMKEINFRHVKKIEPSESKKELIDGNTAFARGLMTAGLDFYFAYPMTPSSSILHYLAQKQKSDGLKVIQPENEISVITMALGASYAGKRTAIGTATGGFALMGEAYSFASIAEFPLAIAVSMRQGPATGVPTYSSQTDMRFVLHAGHGEFPRIVIAPGDPKEAFHAGIDAMNLAWKYQMPVIVLLDKILSEHSMTSTIDGADTKRDDGLRANNPGKSYGRYAFTDNGISPIAFPGTKDTVVHVTSYEHDEEGITTDEVAPVKAMIDKRIRKAETIAHDMGNFEPVKVYGDPTSENAIIFFGSAKSPILEAAKFIKRPLALVQIRWLAPFPTEATKNALTGKKRIIGIEANHEAQLAGLMREKTGIATTDTISRFDSRPFDPEELAQQIDSLLS